MNLTKISVRLSWLLRHCQTPLYISLNGGWADVNTIISVLREKNPEFDLEALKQIVAEDEKGRYGKIRTASVEKRDFAKVKKASWRLKCILPREPFARRLSCL